MNNTQKKNACRFRFDWIGCYWARVAGLVTLLFSLSAHAQFEKVDSSYFKIAPVAKLEIPNMPAYSSQFYFPICSAKVAEVLQNHLTCKQRNIKNCAKLDARLSVSPLNYLQFMASFESNSEKRNLNYRTLPINDLSGLKYGFIHPVAAFYGMNLMSFVMDKNGRKAVDENGKGFRKKVKMCTEEDFPFEQFLVKNRGLIPEVTKNIEEISARTTETTKKTDLIKVYEEMFKIYKTPGDLEFEFQKMKELYENLKRLGNFQKQNIDYNNTDEREAAGTRAVESCPDCLTQAASDLSSLLPIDFKNEQGKEAIAIGLQQDSFEEFLFEIILRNCKGRMLDVPDFSVYPLSEPVSIDDGKKKIVEVLGRGYPISVSYICTNKKHSDGCGLHAVVISGYQKICKSHNDCKELFKVHNSWGWEWQRFFTDDGWVDLDVFMKNFKSVVKYEHALNDFRQSKDRLPSPTDLPLPNFELGSLVWLEPAVTK